MSSEKTLAIVIRVVEFSETSCVVTLFTRDFGKLGALAKGARRPRSPFESALDLLAVCRIVFLHKSTEALDLLTEAKLERRFRAATRDLSRLYAGYYVAELLREMTDTGDPHPDLFDAADHALRDLDGNADASCVVFRFEMTALRLLGHLPSLGGCAVCGGPIASAGRQLFSPAAGGLLCAPCRRGERAVISVTSGAIELLRRFASPDPVAWREITLDARVRGELRGVVSQYICHLLDHRPRMHPHLGPPGGSRG